MLVVDMDVPVGIKAIVWVRVIVIIVVYSGKRSTNKGLVV